MAQIQRITHDIHKWVVKFKIKINSEKCETIILSDKISYPNINIRTNNYNNTNNNEENGQIRVGLALLVLRIIDANSRIKYRKFYVFWYTWGKHLSSSIYLELQTAITLSLAQLTDQSTMLLNRYSSIIFLMHFYVIQVYVYQNMWHKSPYLLITLTQKLKFKRL